MRRKLKPGEKGQSRGEALCSWEAGGLKPSSAGSRQVSELVFSSGHLLHLFSEVLMPLSRNKKSSTAAVVFSALVLEVGWTADLLHEFSYFFLEGENLLGPRLKQLCCFSEEPGHSPTLLVQGYHFWKWRLWS